MVLRINSLHSLTNDQIPEQYTAIAWRHLPRRKGVVSALFTMDQAPDRFMYHFWKVLYKQCSFDYTMLDRVMAIHNIGVPIYIGISASAKVYPGDLITCKPNIAWSWYGKHVMDSSLYVYFQTYWGYIGVSISPEYGSIRVKVQYDFFAHRVPLRKLLNILCLPPNWMVTQESIGEGAEGIDMGNMWTQEETPEGHIQCSHGMYIHPDFKDKHYVPMEEHGRIRKVLSWADLGPLLDWVEGWSYPDRDPGVVARPKKKLDRIRN